MTYILRLTLISIYFLFINFKLKAQDKTIDSLKRAIKTSKHDTITVKTSISLGEVIYQSEPDKATELWKFSVRLCEKNLAKNLSDKDPCKAFYLKYQAGALNNIGFIIDYHGDTPTALIYYHKSLNILKKINDKDGIATASNNIGYIYKNQGDISKALDFYHYSLKIREEIKDDKGVANSLNNIGFIYDNQGDIDKAFEYFERSLKIQETINDKKGIASSLNNIGSIYKKKSQINESLAYFTRSLKVITEINDKKGIAKSLNNIGDIYLIKGEIDKALDYFQKSLKIREEIIDKQGIANSLNSIASTLLKKGAFKEAQSFAERSLKVAKELGFPEHIKSSAMTLKSIYKNQNKFDLAFKMFELEMQMQDSLKNTETKKASISKQFQYEYDKKNAADSVMNAQKQKIEKAHLFAKDEQLKHGRTQRFALGGGLILVLIFSFIMYKRFKISQNQKIIIEKQKDEVEYQKKEIIDSITYAKRLQKAILPHRIEILETIPQSFVIYLPKDIVAGDFYWAETINEYYYIAVADCTGHGVPGAMVSMVCSNAMNRTINEFKLTETGEILDKVRDLVLNTFIRSGDDIQDGMDISFCRINKLTKEIQWSGANNPLWYFNNNQLQEIKADKQPIGKYDYAKPFTTHRVIADLNTNFYLFTDGFSDQFGIADKKMTKKRFKDLIISIQGNDMANQKQLIENYFEKWKGETEQVDDVCIIGLTI